LILGENEETQGLVAILGEESTIRVGFGKVDLPQLFLELFLKRSMPMTNKNSLSRKGEAYF
jgi:hypothetical protein